MKLQVGTCPQCGAPIYAPMVWGRITPPPNEYSCSCWLGNINVSWVSEKTTYQPMNTSQPKYTQEDLDRAVVEERKIIADELRRLSKLCGLEKSMLVRHLSAFIKRLI